MISAFTGHSPLYRSKKKKNVGKLFTPGVTVAFSVLVIILLACIFAPVIAPYDPNAQDLTQCLAKPSAEHLLGCDQNGRDLFSRILYGGRISIIVGLGSALGAALVGVTLGLYVGYKGGLMDNLLIKISDIFQSVPQMVLIIIIVALVGQSMENLIIIFILTGWPGMYRMTRSKVLSLKQQEFVQALRAFGISDVKIAFKHLLPNTLGPVVVNITLSTAMFILQEASLSVLGYGVPMEIATWGNIINVITNGGTIRFDWLQYWWMWLPCALMLILFVLSINFIGDGLRDASDPTQIG